MSDPRPVNEPRMLAFYDRLRARIRSTLGRGALTGRAADLLLLAPDVFMLMLRLSLDSRVPGSSRSLIGGALLYFVMPFDFFPEGILGVGGFVDDLALAAAVLAHVLSDELEPIAHSYWSGPGELRVVLRDVARGSEALLGERGYLRLRRLFGSRFPVGGSSAGSDGSGKRSPVGEEANEWSPIDQERSSSRR